MPGVEPRPAGVQALVRALGFGPRADADDTDDATETTPATKTTGRTREEILEALARHDITAEEAATAIRGLGRTTR